MMAETRLKRVAKENSDPGPDRHPILALVVRHPIQGHLIDVDANQKEATTETHQTENRASEAMLDGLKEESNRIEKGYVVFPYF
jgi:hypothetical protein